MARFSPSGAASPDVSLEGASSFTVENVSVVSADTEVSHTLPNNTVKFMLRARNFSRIQLADSTGLTDTTYVTISPGVCWPSESLDGTQSFTIYFETSKAGEVIEILSWQST